MSNTAPTGPPIATASSSTNVTVTQTPATGTDYIVVRLSSGADGRVGIESTWDLVGTTEAVSAKAAIRKIADKTAGTYVAIPKRSWTPTVVSVETETVVKLA